MQLPPIPPSVRTSAAGFLSVLFGWVAMIPGVPPPLAAACGALSMLFTGTGFYLAADAHALRKTAEDTARVCATCGRPAALPPSPAAETPLP